MHRLPCVVIERLGTKRFLYKLQCTHGVLTTCYPGSELEAHTGPVNIISDWKSASTVSLREAAKKSNPLYLYYGTFCNCKGDCTGRKCSCQLAHKPCSIRCHSGRSCLNHHDSMIAPQDKPSFNETDKDLKVFNKTETPPTSLSSSFQTRHSKRDGSTKALAPPTSLSFSSQTRHSKRNSSTKTEPSTLRLWLHLPPKHAVQRETVLPRPNPPLSRLWLHLPPCHHPPKHAIRIYQD